MSDIPVPALGDAEALVATDTPEVHESTEEAEAPRSPAEPIASRFLFVDVAAQRAKQLRRGARPRVDMPETHKLERVAMREVSDRFVDWTLPEFKGAQPSDNS